MDGIRAAGEGRLYQEFLLLKEKLTAEGLFDADRKRPIPSYPNIIGVVTSPTGAALQDVLNTLKGRYPLADVILSPASVQGEAAPGEIVRALESLNAEVHPDVIIVGRGGGSLEDLWAFNDEGVVRAVAASDAPVISGVGHETDFTLTDFAADLRAPTPTGAAVAAVPEMAEISTEFSRRRLRLEQAMREAILTKKQTLLTTTFNLENLSPQRKISGNIQRLDMLSMRMDHLMHGQVSGARQHLALAMEKLNAYDPRQILKRGYAMIEDEHKDVVTSIQQVQLGQNVRLKIFDGTIRADVTDVEKRDVI